MKTAIRERMIRDFKRYIEESRDSRFRAKPYPVRVDVLEWMCHEIEDHWYGSRKTTCNHIWTRQEYVSLNGNLENQIGCRKCPLVLEVTKPVTEDHVNTSDLKLTESMGVDTLRK